MPEPGDLLLSVAVPVPSHQLIVGDALKERPHLAELMMRVIANWAHAEFLMSRLAVGFAEKDHVILAAVLEILRTKRQEAIDAAAKAALSADELQVFSQADAKFKDRRRQRDKYAHGIWAITDDLPEDLVWMDAKHLIRHEAREEAWWSTHLEQPGPIDMSSYPSLDRAECVVYDAARINRDLMVSLRVGAFIVQLSRVFGSKTLRVAPELRQLLHDWLQAL